MFLLVFVQFVHVLTSRLGIATVGMMSSIQLFGNYLYMYMYTVAASGWRESHDLVF